MTRVPVALIIFLLVSARLVHGQEDEVQIRQRWLLEGLRAVWCVSYLADPADPDMKLPKGYALVPAARAAGLPAGLQRQISDEPTYADWIPGRFCTVSAEVITVDDRRVTGKNPNQIPSVAFAAVLAAPVGGGDSRPSYAARFFAASEWRTTRPAEAVVLRLAEVKVTMGKVPESTDDQIEVKYGKLVVTWSGYATKDSSEAQGPVELETVFASPQGYLWTARFHLTPRMVNPVAGALRVGGKGDEFKAIQASPIRLMGPIYSGGAGEVTYSRP
jgi:hypothetical protein